MLFDSTKEPPPEFRSALTIFNETRGDPAVSVLKGQLAQGVCVVPSDAIRRADHEPLASSHEASAASPSKIKAAQPAHGAKSECPGTQLASLVQPVSRFYFFVTL